MNDIETMFDHLVSRVCHGKGGDTADYAGPGHRGTREAPQWSEAESRDHVLVRRHKHSSTNVRRGTESPLLALNMISKAIKGQHGLTLSFNHVFSCEIEPFKQAYIERNFSPPVLFRDVTELGRNKAHTAYGSLVPVPGNVDVRD